MDIRDRIVDFKRMPGRELQDNEGNWRVHPQFQKDMLGQVLAEVGIAGALTAYYSERNEGRLTLIDGHLRKDEYGDLEWPVQILDVTDQEADLLLLTFDPLAAMAETSGEALRSLVSETETDNTVLQAFFDQQEAEADLALLMAEMESDLAAGKTGKAGVMGDRKRERFISVIICVDDLSDFEQALMATGELNRGEAILTVCRAYLDESR